MISKLREAEAVRKFFDEVALIRLALPVYLPDADDDTAQYALRHARRAKRYFSVVEDPAERLEMTRAWRRDLGYIADSDFGRVYETLPCENASSEAA